MNEDGLIVGLQVITQPLVLWLVGGGVMTGNTTSALPTRRRKKVSTEVKRPHELESDECGASFCVPLIFVLAKGIQL